MSAKKFERLIDLIINEDQARAEQLFHDIIVEKSRQIYESIMEEGDMVGDMDEEIEFEGAGMKGMMEDDEEFDDSEMSGDFEDENFGDDSEGDGKFGGGDDEEFGDDSDGEGEFGDDEEEFGDDEEGSLEDRMISVEDRLDQLMADFEADHMGDSDDEDDEEFGGDDMDSDEGEEEGEEEEESGLMEAAELKKVTVTHGDNGVQTKSPVRAGAGAKGMQGSPVKFAGAHETVPTSAKKASNAYTKGEKQEDFGNINVPGGNAGKTAFKTKAPAPKTETVKAKSPVAEARKTVKRRI